MATRRSDRETAVTLRLPKELHDRLRSEAGERGFAQFVRERLERASGVVGEDPQTNSFLALVAGGAREVTGSWHEDPDAYAIFKFWVDAILLVFKPDGEPSFDPAAAKVEAIALSGAVGKSLGADVLKLMLEMRVRLLEQAAAEARAKEAGKP